MPRLVFLIILSILASTGIAQASEMRASQMTVSVTVIDPMAKNDTKITLPAIDNGAGSATPALNEGTSPAVTYDSGIKGKKAATLTMTY